MKKHLVLTALFVFAAIFTVQAQSLASTHKQTPEVTLQKIRQVAEDQLDIFSSRDNDYDRDDQDDCNKCRKQKKSKKHGGCDQPGNHYGKHKNRGKNVDSCHHCCCCESRKHRDCDDDDDRCSGRKNRDCDNDDDHRWSDRNRRDRDDDRSSGWNKRDRDSDGQQQPRTEQRNPNKVKVKSRPAPKTKPAPTRPVPKRKETSPRPVGTR